MSVKRIEFHAGATADVNSAVAWYKQRSPQAALDFIEELRKAIETIREDPHRWPSGKNNTRRFPLWRFPFAIIYSEHESTVIVWAVAHGSRSPDYWLRRL